MRRALAVLGGLLLLNHAGPASAQIGFAFGGKRFAVRGYIGGVIAPAWYSPGVVPWGYAGPVSVVRPVGYWVPPPPVVVVGYPVLPRYGLFGPDDRPQPGTFDLPPMPDGFARQRVDNSVKRGDLLVVRPGGVPKQPEPPVGFAPRPGFVPEPVGVPKDPKERSAFEITRARQAFAGGEYGRATERLADAIAASPDESLAYFLLAQTRVARGEYAEAVAAIRAGMSRAPNWPATTFNLKELYGPNAAAFDEHLGELKQAATAESNNPTLGFLLGYHLWFLGEKAEAVKYFKRAARQMKDGKLIERFLADAGRKKV